MGVWFTTPRFWDGGLCGLYEISYSIIEENKMTSEIKKFAYN